MILKQEREREGEHKELKKTDNKRQGGKMNM